MYPSYFHAEIYGQNYELPQVIPKLTGRTLVHAASASTLLGRGSLVGGSSLRCLSSQAGRMPSWYSKRSASLICLLHTNLRRSIAALFLLAPARTMGPGSSYALTPSPSEIAMFTTRNHRNPSLVPCLAPCFRLLLHCLRGQ